MNYSYEEEQIINDLAQMQGEIFEESVNLNIPSYFFIQLFMKSKFASSMDKNGLMILH